MFGLNNLKVYWKLRILMAMATVGLGIFAWVAFSTLQTVEVNGPLYQRIDNSQNVASADRAAPRRVALGLRHRAAGSQRHGSAPHRLSCNRRN